MSTPNDDIKIDITLPEYDPLRHGAPSLEPEEAPAPKDMPIVVGEQAGAQGVTNLGPNGKGGFTYYQHRGEQPGDFNAWPEWMDAGKIDNLCRRLGNPTVWKEMWEVFRQGTIQTLGEAGTILVSQRELEAGGALRISFVPRTGISNMVGGKLLEILHTIGTDGYDPVHDMHVTIVMDGPFGLYNPASPLKVVVVRNAKIDDEN